LLFGLRTFAGGPADASLLPISQLAGSIQLSLWNSAILCIGLPASASAWDLHRLPSRRQAGVKRMTARQEGRPEEMPFDEPAEEPPGKPIPYAEPSPEDDPGRPVDPQPSAPPEFS
jgi:hypothetical protein